VIVDHLLRNANYNSTFFFDLFESEYLMSFEQSKIVLLLKKADVVIRLLRDTQIQEGHCQNALAGGKAAIINYVFSRFESKFSLDTVLYPSFTADGNFDLDLVASKLTRVHPLSKFIIKYSNVNLFYRLIEETELSGVSFEDIMPYHYNGNEIIALYLEHHEVHEQEQMKIYSVYGQTFLSVMKTNKQPICTRLLNKINTAERRKEMRKKMPVQKRQRK
jgi:hypothetical protein